MRKLLLVLLVFVGCKSNYEQKKFVYINEESLITSYNEGNKDMPLLVVLPETENSLINNDLLKRLARKYRVVSISFLSPEDPERQKQLDNLTNRVNFYSEYLNLLAVTNTDSMNVLAEGLNANFISHYLHAFPIRTQVYLNPYNPTLNAVFTNVCYANPSPKCDSILNHFRLVNRTVLDSLLVAVGQAGTDRQYGNYTLGFWKDVLDYPLQLNHTDAKLTIIFTTNTGLQSQFNATENLIITDKEELKNVLTAVIRN